MLKFYQSVFIGTALLMFAGHAAAQTEINVVPMPQYLKATKAAPFEITSQTVIVCQPEFEDSAKIIQDTFTRAGQFQLKKVPEPKSKHNIIRFSQTSLNDLKTTESYKLVVTGDGVKITASGSAGAFYAVQTLRQLLPDAIEDTTAPAHAKWTVPAVEIQDTPALPWRGVMLDSARQFQSVDQIKKLLEAMALLKQNRFHWHLIDDNGWRLQIDKYPQLTEIGSVRGPASAVHKGFYSKTDVREIVAYAKARYIEVVPEFEMPAHSNACLNVLPQLSCKGTPYQRPQTDEPAMPWNSWGWYNKHEPPRHFCAGNDDVFRFQADVFNEAMELFPFHVWHVGGDERPAGIWSQCPKCLARMKDKGLKDEHALQEWFMQQVSTMLAAKGKTAISWAICRNERYYDPKDLDNLGNGALLMNWHGSTKLACRLGIPIVNAATPYMYIDYPPFEMYPGWERPDWMPILGLKRMYEFNPIPDGLTKEQEKYVIGAQTCIWSDCLNPDQLFEWIFPRVLAAAETAWLKKADRGTYENFLQRVSALETRFARMGISFVHPVPGGNKGDRHPRFQ